MYNEIQSLVLNLNIEIIIEPGRYLVGASGLILSRVIRTKSGKNKDFDEAANQINNLMPKEEIEELPQFEPIGDEFRRLNLWMPSPEFVQAQLDSEQGARKLFNKEDFPIVVNDW